MNAPDRIAREAARLLDRGAAPSIADAIEAAAARLGLETCDRPGAGLVRRHLQGQAMAALGAEGYADRVRALYESIEHVMTALVEGCNDAEALLVGRAARGRVDGVEAIHVRVYTTCPIGAMAEILVGFGWDEPSFATADTRFGRLDRMILHDEDRPIIITRCLPAMYAHRGLGLYSRKPIVAETLAEVRKRLAE